MQKKSSRSTGVLLSYLTVALTAASNFILIPFYLRMLGADAYGLYEYVYSIASYAMILDFGIANVMIRYITEYRVKGDLKAEENFAAHILLITLTAVLIICGIGLILFINIDHVIVNRTDEELVIARRIFIFMILRIILALLQHFFDGAMLSYERYAAAKGMACSRIVIKLVSVISLVMVSDSVYGIVIGDVLASVACLLISAVIVVKIRFRVRWYFFDRRLYKEVLLLVLALILQSVVVFVNKALGKYVVGSQLSNAMVASYSVAMALNEVFQTLTISINPIFMPKVTKVIAEGADSERITDVAIGIGRIQCILCLAMLGGFAAIGQQFVVLWSGVETVEAWLPALLLMIADVVPLVQSTCLSVLTVCNKRMFRSVILFAIVPINLLLAYFLVGKTGMIGVAIGSSIAFIFGDAVIMNIYYYKGLGLNVRRMLKEIFSGILPAALCATGVSLLLASVLNGNFLRMLVGSGAFCVVYCMALWSFGLRKTEKTYVHQIVARLDPFATWRK